MLEEEYNLSADGCGQQQLAGMEDQKRKVSGGGHHLGPNNEHMKSNYMENQFKSTVLQVEQQNDDELQRYNAVVESSGNNSSLLAARKKKKESPLQVIN